MQPRKRLSDIYCASDLARLEKVWETTEAATDFVPLPSGEYRCLLKSGEVFTAKTGTPGYKMTFEVLDGEHAKRLVWHDVWLSEMPRKSRRKTWPKSASKTPSNSTARSPKESSSRRRSHFGATTTTANTIE